MRHVDPAHTMLFVLIGAIIVSLSACSSVTPMGTAKYSAVAAEHVEVLYQDPKRPYEIIALLSHETATRFSSVQDAVQSCRELAAEAGADAVIITSTFDQTFNTAAKASGKAIKWMR